MPGRGSGGLEEGGPYGRGIISSSNQHPNLKQTPDPMSGKLLSACVNDCRDRHYRGPVAGAEIYTPPSLLRADCRQCGRLVDEQPVTGVTVTVT